jgi:hypothetical protein
MKTSIELFDLYRQKELPGFCHHIPEKISFCTNTECCDCHIQHICDASTDMLPLLTCEEFEKIKGEYPEYIV